LLGSIPSSLPLLLLLLLIHLVKVNHIIVGLSLWCLELLLLTKINLLVEFRLLLLLLLSLSIEARLRQSTEHVKFIRSRLLLLRRGLLEVAEHLILLITSVAKVRHETPSVIWHLLGLYLLLLLHVQAPEKRVAIHRLLLDVSIQTEIPIEWLSGCHV
jgi:hypothetical protein